MHPSHYPTRPESSREAESEDTNTTKDDNTNLNSPVPGGHSLRSLNTNVQNPEQPAISFASVATETSPAPSSSSENQEKHLPMFCCFQRTLHHTMVRDEQDNDFSDTTTFQELKKTYLQSLGFMGKWRTLLSLRSLKKIHRIQVL